jgi:hypothetical protein
MCVYRVCLDTAENAQILLRWLKFGIGVLRNKDRNAMVQQSCIPIIVNQFSDFNSQ